MLRLVVVLLLFDQIFSQTINYCDPKLCSPGVKHVACNNIGVSPKTCTAPRLVMLDQTLINSIIKVHNECRSQLACGLIDGLAPAARMPQLTWNKELAKLAELSVRACQAGDRCRNTAKFKYVGQNILTNKIYSDYISDEIVKGNYGWGYAMSFWLNESENITQADVDVLKVRPANLPIITHFTNVINDKVTELGCAALIYLDEAFILTLVCNYNYANLVGMPVYTKGPQCSKCKTGCSKVYAGLCNVGEIVV